MEQTFYPSTYGAQTNSRAYTLSAQVLQNSAVLPVILSASKVQVFLPEVHAWSSPFTAVEDFGVIGARWSTYDELAPQVGGPIGVANPDTAEMIWVDAAGVGPAGSTTAECAGRAVMRGESRGAVR